MRLRSWFTLLLLTAAVAIGTSSPSGVFAQYDVSRTMGGEDGSKAGISVRSTAPVSENVVMTPSFNEGFDNITTLTGSGWAMINRSNPVGVLTWFQGNATVFPAQAGTLTTSYIGVNFNSGAGTATLSNWLLTPTILLRNGDQIRFWSRTVTTPAFPDRLEVRLSLNGASTNVGATETSVGDFTTLLMTINPTLTTAGYPNTWTQYTLTISGLSTPTNGRIGFRYFVTNGGPSGANSDYIGIDTFEYLALPTAANVSVGGRVVTAEGRGLSGSTVMMTDQSGNVRTASTNAFGYYNFTDIESGQTYVIQVSNKRFRFENNPRTVNVTDNLSDADFQASP